MTIVRAAIALLALTLLGVIVWAATSMTELHGTFMDQAAVLATLPWGVATLVDLGIGFVLLAVLIFLTERSWLVAALWAAPILVLGNLWAAIWFVIRLPQLAKQLSKPDWPAA